MFIYVRNLLLIAFLSAVMTAPALAGNGTGPGTFPGANGKPFQALQGQINDLSQRLAQESTALQALIANLQSQISSNAADVLGLKTRCTLLDDLIAALQAELAVVKQQVALNTSDIAALKTKDLLHEQLFTAMEAKIEVLDARMTANEGDIAALILRDQTLQQLIFALGTQIASLESRVLTNSSEIGSMKSQIADLQGRMATAESQLAAKQNRISQACSPGYSIREIFADGRVSCEYDSVASGVGALVVHNQRESVSDGSTTGFGTFSVRATCPSGYKLTGGGYDLDNDLTFVLTNMGEGGQTWLVTARGTWPLSQKVYADAYCAKVQ